MFDKRKLNIVDEKGEIIGVETRENIHKYGLLHKEIHVLFYTPTGELIFQHRAKDKDTYPDLLDVTVGGHVEIGSDYEQSALQEVEEETGLHLEKEDLQFLEMIRGTDIDEVTHTTNNHLRAVYVYRYEGNIEDLHIEEGKALGFELWSLDALSNLSFEDKKRFIASHTNGAYIEIFKKIREMI
jgi:isopentenyldiphosphate isomerase